MDCIFNLKTEEPSLSATWERRKLFEWRECTDKDCRVGDRLVLHQYPVQGLYRRWITAKVPTSLRDTSKSLADTASCNYPTCTISRSHFGIEFLNGLGREKQIEY